MARSLLFTALGVQPRETRRVSAKSRAVSYLANKEQARQLVYARLTVLNASYGFAYGRVSIKNAKTMWGSCSRKGNLNFNYRLLFLPQYLADYVIVHELCHLQELNHSKRFWELVARTVPDWKLRKKELATYSLRSSQFS